VVAEVSVVDGRPVVDGLPRDELRIGGELYMERFYVHGLAVRVHHIVMSDPGRALHDHPWDFSSELLVGSYREVTPFGERVYGPGCMVMRQAESLHRLVLLGGPVWTLVRTGRPRRVWGFQTAEGWVPHHECGPLRDGVAGA
jgi:hypothetical protein